MIKTILETIRGVTKPVKTDVLDTMLTDTTTIISEDVLPALEQVIEFSDKIPGVKNSRLLSSINIAVGMKASNNTEVLIKIKNIFEGFLSEEKNLLKIIDSKLSRVIIGKQMSARDAAVVKIVEDMFGLSCYTLDLLYITLLDGGDTELPKKKSEQVHKDIYVFTDIIKVYNKNFSKLVKSLTKVSAEKLNASKDQGLLGAMISKTGLIPRLPIMGFKGNPIYHIRLWFIDKSVAKYEVNKEKKKLIELKLTELRLRTEGDVDPGIQRQIEYYEDKVSKIEYDIKDFEES